MLFWLLLVDWRACRCFLLFVLFVQLLLQLWLVGLLVGRKVGWSLLVVVGRLMLLLVVVMILVLLLVCWHLLIRGAAAVVAVAVVLLLR